MKNYIFIAGCMVSALFLQAGILDRIEQEKENISSKLESNGPTAEDIKAANRIESPAATGSNEDKLINAVTRGDLKSVKDFIAKRPNLEARSNQDKTALMIAAEKGHAEIVDLLIKAGANVNAKNKFNWTALFWAAQNKHAKIVEILITNGDATDKQYFKDFLMSAVYTGDIETVKALMLGSARIEDDAFDDFCATALGVCRRDSEISTIIKEARKNRNS